MNRWEVLKQAEVRARAEEQRLCALYECYPWEINIERKKLKNRRKEVLPYIYKHIDNGVEVEQDDIQRIMLKYKIIDDDSEGNIEVDLETMHPDALEEILELFIQKVRNPEPKSTMDQRT